MKNVLENFDSVWQRVTEQRDTAVRVQMSSLQEAENTAQSLSSEITLAVRFLPKF